MSKTTATWDPSGYATVAERVTAFYARFPTGRIVTDLVSQTEHEVLFRAAVYRGPGDPEPAATGWAAERQGDGAINSIACLENTETSAIGRALANLGFTASRHRASAEEMAKAARARARLAEHGADPARRADAGVVATPDRPVAPPTQEVPPIRTDLLRLVASAERVGLRPARARAWRAGIEAAALPEPQLLRCESRLRAWLLRRLP